MTQWLVGLLLGWLMAGSRQGEQRRGAAAYLFWLCAFFPRYFGSSFAFVAYFS